VARPRKQRVSAEFNPDVTTRRELWAHVAGNLRKAILAGGIPAGSSLVEADLAERFAVSRGPIREALRELAREGLVINLPRRGSVVSTLDFNDLREVYSVREGLEIVAARGVVERASDAELAGLAEPVARMEQAWDLGAEYAESLEADLGFHRRLVSLSGNQRLITAYEQMLSQTELLVRTAVVANPTMSLALRRSAHRDILDALMARDRDRAREALDEHYVYAEERLFIGLRAENAGD
jgi:DNA-binding GntR family transcriptional regulator